MAKKLSCGGRAAAGGAVRESQSQKTIVEMEPGALAALICARLCHDLIGPISAIGAALDVLEDGDAEDMHDDARALLRESANGAWARLEFTRLAFGAAGSAPGRLPAGELERVVGAMFDKAKAKITWAGGGESLEKASARVLLNLIVLAVEALPRGGVVTIEILPDGAEHHLVCEGPRARLSRSAMSALAGFAPAEGFDARSIQPYYAGLLARQAGGSANAVVIDDGRIELFAVVPVSEA
jgi:histidine phosphotransferase ChpT